MAAVATMPGLRPLDLGEILDTALRSFGRRWRTLVAAGLIIGVPLSLVSTVLVLAFAPEQFDVDAAENPLTRLTEPGQGDALAAVIAARVTDLVASALAFAACLRVVAGDFVGRDPGAGGAIAFALRRLGSCVGALLVIGVGVGVGLVLLIVPGVWLGTIWALALPVLVVERAGVFTALSRSRALVRGRFWAVLGLLLLAFVITLVCGGLAGAVTGGFASAAGADDEATGAVASFVSSVAGMTVAVPIAAAMLLTMYVDQRVRHEGLTRADVERALAGGDVEAMPQPPAWAAPPAPPAPSEPDDPELPGGWRPPRAGP